MNGWMIIHHWYDDDKSSFRQTPAVTDTLNWGETFGGRLYIYIYIYMYIHTYIHTHTIPINIHPLSSDWPNSTQVQLVDASSITMSEMEITWVQLMCVKWLQYENTCVWEVQPLVHQYFCYNCYMKTKEHSKQLREKIIEKYKSEDGYKKTSSSLDIPQSSVKSITMEGVWHSFKSAESWPSSQTEWPGRKKTREGGHQDTYDHSEGVQSFSGSDGKDCTYNNCCPGPLPVEAVRESGKEKATVEKSSREISPGIRPKACGRLQGQLEESSLVWWDKNWVFWPLDQTLCLANTKHCTSPQTHLHREAWRWQHRALGMLLSSRSWKACRGRGEHECRKISPNPGG